MAVEDRISAFRGDLPAHDVPVLVQRHITFGDCFALEAGLYLALKQAVAAQFQVDHNQVLVVGSAKLGFSITPRKRYRPFGDTSDIDVALCSADLYDAFWRDVFDYWRRREPWPGRIDFRKYHFRGWIRPDYLPPAASFSRAHDWWEFFRQLTASGQFGRFRIRGALYKSLHFLEAYQATCIGQCKDLERGT